MARKRFPPKTKIYASVDSHYCVSKIADMLCMPIQLIPTKHESGEMDMDMLRMSIEDSLDAYAIVILTMGTTIRNAYDDMDDFYNKVVNVMPKVTFHIHVDGAFGGAIYPFFKSQWLLYNIDSFNVSFHKFMGCPNPCALFLTKKVIIQEIDGNGSFGKEMVYLPDKDYTISCSRNGSAVSDMYFKIVLNENFFVDNINNILKCLQLRQYFVENLPSTVAYRESHELSMSVELFNLSQETMDKLKPYGVSVRPNNIFKSFDTHVYICSHVTKELLDEVISVLG